MNSAQRRERNSKLCHSALSSCSEVDTLATGLLRLELDSEDPLTSLNLTACEQSLLSKAVEFNNYFVDHENDPLTLKAALQSVHRSEWIAAMQEEMESLDANETFDLTATMPAEMRPLSTKWVFRTKLNSDNSIRFKARLVVRGFLQKEGIDYDETYAPVATQTSFRLLMALSAKFGWPVRQLDVVTAFLNPKIDKEELWVAIPAGTFNVCKPFGSPVMRLKKALYGLKQSPRLWWETIDAALYSMSLVRGCYDTNLYYSSKVVILLYVDNTLIFDIGGTCSTSTNNDGKMNIATSIDATNIMATLMGLFKMKDLGLLKRFLGFDVFFRNDGIWISQRSYINTIAARYGIIESKAALSPVDEKIHLDQSDVTDHLLDDDSRQRYQSLIGAFLYASLGTRADISFAVSSLSRYCAHPMSSHLTAARRVLRYLYTTRDLHLHYTNSTTSGLRGMCNADWASNVRDRRSMSGYAFFFNDCLISWKAKRQTLVALSTAEAELIACSETCREATWLKNLLSEIIKGTAIGVSDNPIRISCDNQSALKIIGKGLVNPSGRNKHIELRHYHARDMQELGVVIFEYVNTADNLADILTKGLSVKRHQEMTGRMGLKLLS